jgi:hypothetical protein
MNATNVLNVVECVGVESVMVSPKKKNEQTSRKSDLTYHKG